MRRLAFVLVFALSACGVRNPPAPAVRHVDTLAATPQKRIATRNALLTMRLRERMGRTTSRSASAFVARNAQSREQGAIADAATRKAGARDANSVFGRIIRAGDGRGFVPAPTPRAAPTATTP